MREYPKGHWESLENQREFFSEVATKFGIKNPEDWGKVTYKQIMKLGGSSLLNQYSSSLLTALKTVYPGLLTVYLVLIPRYRLEK